MNVRSVRLAVCSILLLAASSGARALPPGYKDDFNGCATQSPDEATRKECCLETMQDCSSLCTQTGPLERASCILDCVWAEQRCEEGTTLPIVAWPGNLGSVPGLTAVDDRVVPDRGRELVASQSAVLVELRGKDPATAEACAAFVVACECPAGSGAKGLECRAYADAKGTACRICKRGAPADACKPCPDCRPELLSAQPCAASDRPTSRKNPRPATPK